MKELYIKIMDALSIPMNTWRAYSLKHLEVVAIVVILALAFAFLFAKSKVKKSGVITTFGIILLILEIVKQCLLTYVNGGYSWSDFPWQLCNIPLYLCLIYPHIKTGRLNFENFLMTFGFIGAVASLIEPSSSIYPYLVLTLQSFIWHGILLMLAIYLMMSNSKARSVRTFGNTLFLYVVVGAIAVVVNMAFRNVSRGACNMFFFGPSYPNMYILNAIYSAYGWIVETVAMALASMATAFVVYFVSGMGKKK